MYPAPSYCRVGPLFSQPDLLFIILAATNMQSMPPNYRPSQYRPLLPVKPENSEADEQGVPASSPRGRRVSGLAAVACEVCRKRKTKCSAERPRCAFCVSKGLDCEYATGAPGESRVQALKRRYDELHQDGGMYQHVYEFLRGRPKPYAEDIYKRIRSGHTAESIMRYIEEGDILQQLCVVPETRYRYVFPYSAEMPPSLLQPDNPYLDSLIYEWTYRNLNESVDHRRQFNHASAPRPASSTVSSSSSGSNNPDMSQCHDAYLRPYHAAEIVEPLLASVKPSQWTTVSSDDKLMRRLIGAYFMCQHPWLTALHKDCFLQDMAANRFRFCSPLLVNALLANACFCLGQMPERYKYWNPHSLGYLFLAEAKRLWELETGRRRLTTVQAAMLLNTLLTMNGMDKLGWTYIIQAAGVAQQLRLFDADLELKNERERMARNFTAWAFFNFQSMVCFYFLDAPLISTPPMATLPDPSVCQPWYGELWLKYPMAQSLIPVYYGHLFRATAMLRIIANQIARATFEAQSTHENISFEQTTSFYSRLLEWYKGLPSCLSSSRVVFPGQFQLQYVSLEFISELTSPFTDNKKSSLANDVVSMSTRNWETLLRLYYLRHGFDSADMFLTQTLVVLGFLTTNTLPPAPEPSQPAPTPAAAADLEANRSSLILAAKGLRDQGRIFYLSRVTLSLLEGGMRPEEKQLLGQINDLHDYSRDKRRLQLHETRARTGDTDAKRLDNLVQRYVGMDIGGESSPAPSSPLEPDSPS
ncbi:hypothetical protein BX600DRAFT_490687 [Xylariales sp. PMI_506]|nr:hypothetical protein BX600DRAFT_490687 [Xylariales sp. PMI_506]